WFAAGNSSFDLMQTAAACVANSVTELAGDQPLRILVLAGPGNNGGDALVAAHFLEGNGHQVSVVGLPPPGGWSGDAARARELWAGPVLAPDAPWPEVDLILDGLFGTGLARPLEGAALDLVRKANAHPALVVAIDMPSGVDADSGQIPNEAIIARRTVTFHCGKPGLFLFPGRICAGEPYIADIGIPLGKFRLWRNGPGLWQLPQPPPMGHKYARGGALVWSGPELATGASRLAARAALRAGAGAVMLVGPAPALRVHAAQVTAIMLHEGDAQAFARLLGEGRWRAACVGPGAGEGVRCVAGAALESGKAVVLDADALTAFAGEADQLVRLVGRHERPVVLTPHEGEFARLFPDIRGSKLERAMAAAQQTGAVMVLKGPDTVIASPEGPALINANAPKYLATAGSGDVLAGFVTALLAQGMDGFDAAAGAVWLHGATACRIGPGLTAEDLLALEPFRAAFLEGIGQKAAHDDAAEGPGSG
ncbi:MAG: NAD(P)H-hydrate dehydratase, partial [Sphingomonadaceae bacterium]